jgi:hypothetical protein
VWPLMSMSTRSATLARSCPTGNSDTQSDTR